VIVGHARDERHPKPFLFWAQLSLLLALAAWIYHPGLSGVFLFDDFANLPALGAFGPIDNWTAFWRYLTSGTADPTGRPLAQLSFLIDARNWPADPYPFKRTSLIIHLVNGILLALLLRRLGRTAHRAQARVDAAAVLGAALWLLHPLFVSTTLYVVQREAMLPVTFVLLGLIGYGYGRDLIGSGQSRGIWISAAMIIVSTILAVASKANGMLLPMLAWLVEALLLEPVQPIPTELRDRFAWMRRLILGLPSVVVLIWLALIGVKQIVHGTPSFRPWTLAERLTTEARIVCEYLALLWLPHPYTAGVFNDAVRISTGLLSPPSTLLSIVFLAALFSGAVAIRRKAPALALSVLFFLAGHLLESTVVPLELYYEHRNYLPALLMFWPLALWLTGDGQAIAIRRGLAILLPLMLAAMTHANADLWGDAQEQALVWAEKNPDSPRAQAYAASAERSLGRPDLAAARMQRVKVPPQEEIQIALNQVGAQCELGEVDAATLKRAQDSLRTTRSAGRLYLDWIGAAIERVRNGDACRGLGIEEIRSLLDAMDENPNTRSHGGWRQDNLSLRGSLALTQHDAHAALAAFNEALDADPRAATALVQAAQMGSAGYPAEALSHLDHFESLPKKTTGWEWSMRGIHSWLLQRQSFEHDEIEHLRTVLEEDIRHTAGQSTESTER
jgi:tetratricopeptide (TPR) repeat protein